MTEEEMWSKVSKVVKAIREDRRYNLQREAEVAEKELTEMLKTSTKEVSEWVRKLQASKTAAGIAGLNTKNNLAEITEVQGKSGG